MNMFNILLDTMALAIHNLNMFKADKHAKGEQTREEILDSALELFRQHGFDATTMRDIAVKAGVALGAAYYYFASKDAIVQAYYEKVQQEHTARLRQMKMDGLSLRQRLAAVFYSKLDILENDRKLLGAIFRYSGEPAHPLSCLGPGTRVVREQSMQVIADAVTPDFRTMGTANGGADLFHLRRFSPTAAHAQTGGWRVGDHHVFAAIGAFPATGICSQESSGFAG